jgi:hypothetical protein
VADPTTVNRSLVTPDYNQRGWDQTLNYNFGQLEGDPAAAGCITIPLAERPPAENGVPASTSLHVRVAPVTFLDSAGVPVAFPGEPALLLPASASSYLYLDDVGTLVQSLGGGAAQDGRLHRPGDRHPGPGRRHRRRLQRHPARRDRLRRRRHHSQEAGRVGQRGHGRRGRRADDRRRRDLPPDGAVAGGHRAVGRVQLAADGPGLGPPCRSTPPTPPAPASPAATTARSWPCRPRRPWWPATARATTRRSSSCPTWSCCRPRSGTGRRRWSPATATGSTPRRTRPSRGGGTRSSPTPPPCRTRSSSGSTTGSWPSCPTPTGRTPSWPTASRRPRRWTPPATASR